MTNILQESRKQLKHTQEQFWTYLSDKTIPIHERWSDFLAAPNELMREDLYCFFSQAIPDIFQSRYKNALDNVSRYQYVYFDFLEEVFDENGDVNPEYLTHHTIHDVHAAIEVLLHKAVNRIKMDW